MSITRVRKITINGMNADEGSAQRRIEDPARKHSAERPIIAMTEKRRGAVGPSRTSSGPTDQRMATNNVRSATIDIDKIDNGRIDRRSPRRSRRTLRFVFCRALPSWQMWSSK